MSDHEDENTKSKSLEGTPDELKEKNEQDSVTEPIPPFLPKADHKTDDSSNENDEINLTAESTKSYSTVTVTGRNSKYIF